MTPQETFATAARIDATEAETEAANAALFSWASEQPDNLPAEWQDGN